MQNSRRDFVKTTAIVAAGAATIGATVMVASGSNAVEAGLYGSHGVVVGSSNKKEINYKKNLVWENYYRNAK
ncbi:MAG: twin-arginine translocation signal domain-containing protein [Campylobacteraceae bacterium]|nr:twin-arginine translocation signal domain-containing protein [Campylobacteraceae bacterium]